MGFRNAATRLLAVGSALAASAGLAPAAAETPPLIWRDVATIRILCLVATENGVEHGALRDRICARARDIAAAGAPAPVSIGDSVGPDVLAPDSLTLLVHVSVEATRDGRLAALSVRPFRNTGSDGGLLFAAAPRAALIPESQDEAEALDGPLNAALSETLPWLARPVEPRPIQN